MKDNKFPVLKISNINWDKDHDELEKYQKFLDDEDQDL